MKTKGPVYVLSDATAETAERVLRAALIQFRGVDPRLRIFSMIRKNEQIERALQLAADDGALVVHTIVNADQRLFLGRTATKLGLLTVDVIGHMMSQLSRFLEEAPVEQPGVPQLTEEYFRRIEAVEFAVKHDDGQALRTLAEADIVLVGLSRTSKTPLSTYLAQKGWKVANVPLVLGLPLPGELEHVDQDRVFGLTIDLKSLIRIRRARLQALNMPSTSDYGRRDHILRELEYGRSIFDAHPHWLVIDVSEKAIEETAAIVLRKMEERKRVREESAADEAGPPTS